MNTIQETLDGAAAALQDVSPTARLDVEVLLAFLLNWPRTRLIVDATHELEPQLVQEYWALVARRKKGEPVSYLTGVKEFWGLELLVTPAVLIPRPETEHLVEQVLALTTPRGEPLRLLDLGTGSGCIAIALAYEFQNRGQPVRVTAVDSSASALQVAKQNVEKHRLGDLIELRESHWCDALPEDAVFDVVTANPPYIAEGDPNVSTGTAFEPHSALYAGRDGLRDIRDLIDAVPAHLSSDGLFLMEIGSKQESVIQEIVSESKLILHTFYCDLAGHVRGVVTGNR